MCGIVGFTGENNATENLLSSLKKLEYRGYDSSGVAVVTEKGTLCIKSAGKIEKLCEKLNNAPTKNSKTGIAHTRWATHGKPDDINAHPHISFDGRIHLVHNGIIENYAEIKCQLEKEGIVFSSETDTEAAVHLFAKHYNGNFLEAMEKCRSLLKGSYAFAIIAEDKPDTVFAVRHESPLIAARGKNCNFLASDIPALCDVADSYCLLEEDDMAIITKDEIKIFSKNGKEKELIMSPVPDDILSAQKGNFDTFMLKEISEQGEKVRLTLNKGIKNGHIETEFAGLGENELKNIRKVHIAACGSALHVGIAARYIFEKIAKTECVTDFASEFRYRDLIFDKNDILMAISQSGETADTLAALRIAKKKNILTLSLVNALSSTIERESDFTFQTPAGPEIAVATTKAFSCQLAAVYLFALSIAKAKGILSQQDELKAVKQLNALPELINTLVKEDEEIKNLAEKLASAKSVFFMGRQLDFAGALEGSLKLKEISYIFSESYAAGELKHGTISLISENTPVVALITQENVFEKTLSNIKEVKARGAFVVAICFKKDAEKLNEADAVITLPDAADFLGVSLATIPLQLLAYHTAQILGRDIDKPRNLAKSVTVE